MPQPELDPAFTAYVRDEPTITYAQPGDLANPAGNLHR